MLPTTRPRPRPRAKHETKWLRAHQHQNLNVCVPRRVLIPLCLCCYLGGRRCPIGEPYPSISLSSSASLPGRPDLLVLLKRRVRERPESTVEQLG